MSFKAAQHNARGQAYSLAYIRGILGEFPQKIAHNKTALHDATDYNYATSKCSITLHFSAFPKMAFPFLSLDLICNVIAFIANQEVIGKELCIIFLHKDSLIVSIRHVNPLYSWLNSVRQGYWGQVVPETLLHAHYDTGRIDVNSVLPVPANTQ